MHIITVSQKTTASKEKIWELWADALHRPRWDKGIEKITIDGPFELGMTGDIKVFGQPSRKFKIIECDHLKKYTDRFFLPMGGKMDWHHSITDTPDGQHDVTWEITVSGPTSFMLLPIMKKILNKEIPVTVERFVALAEGRPVE